MPGVAALGLTRDAATGLAEGAVPALGNLLIAGLGLWLMWRGLRGRVRRRAAGRVNIRSRITITMTTSTDACGCGHAHAPTPD